MEQPTTGSRAALPHLPAARRPATVTSATPFHLPRLRRALILAFLAYFAMQVGILALVYWLDRDARTPERWRVAWTSTLLFVVWAATIPAMVRWIVRRPWQRRRFLPQIAHHGARVLLLAILVATFFYLTGGALGFRMPPYLRVLPLVLPTFAATGALLYTAVAALVTLAQNGAELERVELEALELRRDLEATRVRSVKTRLEPDFMARALERIEQLVDADPARADLALTRLADVLRLNLELSDKATISLVDAVDYLEAFLQLLSLLQGAEIALTTDLSRAALAVPVEPFTLRHLAEPVLERVLAGEVAAHPLHLRAWTGPGRALELELWRRIDGHAVPAAPAPRPGAATAGQDLDQENDEENDGERETPVEATNPPAGAMVLVRRTARRDAAPDPAASTAPPARSRGAAGGNGGGGAGGTERAA